jgi:hypothetical protein
MIAQQLKHTDQCANCHVFGAGNIMKHCTPLPTWRAVRSWSSAFTSQLKSRDSVPSCSAAAMRLVSFDLQTAVTEKPQPALMQVHMMHQQVRVLQQEVQAMCSKPVWQL